MVRPFCLFVILIGLWLSSAVSFAANWPPIPDDALGFHRWIVDTRAEGILQSFKPNAPTPERVVPHHGGAEDANMAAVLAAAYTGPWSRYYHQDDVRQKGLAAVDALATIYLNPAFRKSLSGLDPQFTLHAFSVAVLFWQESGAVSPMQITRWRQALRAIADDAIAKSGYFLAGDYANPEFYYLSGLAVAAKLTGESRYREEAQRAIRRFADDLYPGGGMSYFMDSNPQMGYQGMVVLSTALYWEMTDDPLARDMLQQMTGYYATALHPQGFAPMYESPCLKQHWDHPFFNPSPVRLLACVTGDGQTAAIADAVERRYREGLKARWPSFLATNTQPYWYNHHHAKDSALTLRYWKEVTPEPVPTRRVMADSNHRGARVVWDDFAGFFTTRPFSATRAGCMVTDAGEPFAPVNAALALAIPEALETRQRGRRPQTDWFVSNERWPHQQLTDLQDLQVMTQANRLSETYWAAPPYREGDNQLPAQGCWQAVETWAVLPNLLVGLVNLRALTDGGMAGTDWARIRFVLYPQNRALVQQVAPMYGLPTMRGAYGKLGFMLMRLHGDDWEWRAMDATGQPPTGPPDAQMPKQTHLSPVQPALVKKTVPWKAGDSATIACAWSPVGSGALDTVAARLVQPYIAALVVRHTDTHAWLIAMNQATQHMDVQFTPDPTWTVRMVRGNAAFTPSPLDGIARLSLQGETHAVFDITARQGALPSPPALLTRLALTGGRGYAPPTKK